MEFRWIFIALVASVARCQELLKNADLDGTAHWDCYHIKCYSTDDHHSGGQAVKATSRHNFYEGPSQNVLVHEHTTYSFQGWAKLVTDHGKNQKFELEVEYSLKNGHKSYVTVARRDNVRTSTGWFHLSGTFVTPDSHLTSHISIENSLHFIVDTELIVGRTREPGCHFQIPPNGRILKLNTNLDARFFN